VALGKVLGVNIAFNVIAPVGWKEVEAGASLSGIGVLSFPKASRISRRS
jgi:hypothetical protein